MEQYFTTFATTIEIALEEAKEVLIGTLDDDWPDVWNDLAMCLMERFGVTSDEADDLLSEAMN